MAKLVVTTASHVPPHSTWHMPRPLSDAGFPDVGGRGPTDGSGTAYPRPSPTCSSEYLFAQTKEDPQCVYQRVPLARKRQAYQLVSGKQTVAEAH